MFLLKKAVNTQLRGLCIKMIVNITQLLVKAITTEILSPTSETCIKKIQENIHSKSNQT